MKRILVEEYGSLTLQVEELRKCLERFTLEYKYLDMILGDLRVVYSKADYQKEAPYVSLILDMIHSCLCLLLKEYLKIKLLKLGFPCNFLLTLLDPTTFRQ